MGGNQASAWHAGSTMAPVTIAPRRREVLVVATFVPLSIVIQILLQPACCTGPDVDAYLRLAEEQLADPRYLLNPQAFDGNFWAFPYPLFLAGLLHITGGSLSAVIPAHMLLASLLAPGTWLLAFRLGTRIRVASSAVVAVSPPTVWMGTHLGYEVLLALALTTSVALAWSVPRAPARWGSWSTVWITVLSGLFLGAAILIQTKSAALLPVLVFLYWKRGGRALAAGIIGVLLAILPWSIRNLVVLGNPYPFSGNGPYNLWVGNNPEAVTGGFMVVAPPIPAGTSSQTQAAVDFILSQPESAATLVFRKAARLWEPLFLYPDLMSAGTSRHLLHLVVTLFSAFIIIGFFGFVAARFVTRSPDLPEVTPLAVLVLLFISTHLLFIAEPRFLAPVVPFTVTISVATIGYAIRRHRAITSHAMTDEIP